jgi:putative transposase
MARQPRLQLSGYTYHVVQRGHNRSACFPSPRDYEMYLGLLNEMRRLFPCAVHAYVLMPNHVHLLTSPVRPENLSLMMKNVTQRYVQHVNRIYSRTGSLWEGRFRACAIDSESYLLRCQRYIELNPVRAQLVSDPAEWAWSSFRANTGSEPSLIIEPHETYMRIASDESERIDCYRQFVFSKPSDGELAAIRKAFSRREPLGSDPGV